MGIACKICGKKYRKVVSHVYQSHGMNKREYKEEFGLDVKRGIVLPETRDYLGKLVKENGTVNNLKAGRKYWFKKGISNNYQRSEQTMERLRKHWAIVRTLKKEGK